MIDIAMSAPFRGGFLLGRASREMLTSLPDGEHAFGHWDERKVGKYQLHFDPMFPCHQAVVGNSGVVCLGYVCDTVDPDTPQRTVDRLARAWALSRNTLNDRLTDCGGTFVLFAHREGAVEVFLDATGTVGVCYSTVNGEVVAASHPNLLSELFGFRMSALADFWLNHPLINQGGRYFPGIRTAFDEVRILTPNTTLGLPSGTISRVFPTQEFSERPLEEIVSSLVPALHRQIEWMASQAPLAVSISGGLDSRVTLSAMRPVANECLFFTYNVWNTRVLRTDMEIATRLTETLGLNHLPIRVKRGSPPPASFLDAWHRTHGTSLRGEELVYAYCEHLAGRYVHVRSNILEVARGFYTKMTPLNQKYKFDAHKLARLFRTKAAVELESYFDEFIEVTGFRKGAMKGFHYTDMFYWEHRLGTWLSGLLRAARADHHTLILYNCRRIIETLIARPLEERNTANVMFALMHEMWPEVLSVPIFSGSKFLSASGLPLPDIAQPAVT